MKKLFSLVLFLVVGFGLSLGFIIEDPFGSKNTNSADTRQIGNNPVHVSYGTPVYTDNFDGANDTTALRTRGYKIYQNSVPLGITFWFQGNETVFPAYNGPTTGYVGANFNATSGAGQIDVWMVTPKVTGGMLAGDSLYFYSRTSTGSTWPDSIRVMYSTSDSTISGTWTELGRFLVSAAGTWEKRGFRAPSASANGRFAIRYTVANGGPSGSNSNYIGIDALTIERSGTPPPAFSLPDLIYYRFENNPAANLTPNFAIPGAGTNPAPLTTLTLTSGGQFDSCLSGTATTSAKIMTGYNLSTGTSSFTISMWLGNLGTPSTTRYLFGDMGHSFRCFVGGVAPSGGALLRGTGVTDVQIPNIIPGPNVIHIVYDSASTSVKIYKNGVLENTVVQANPWNFTSGTGFSVGGYSSSAGIDGLMDEFRFYKRGLDSAEIANTWNLDLGVVTAVTPVVSNVPDKYSLSQNYPNPFNPATKINFAIPKSGLVTLKIYDILGREVSTLVNEVKNAGTYMVDFNANNLSSGMYFYKVSVNGFTDVKKMMLIK
ncbi:MAG: choice-of-anchor J domain-containing protein [Ignavibacteria bacterium]